MSNAYKVVARSNKTGRQHKKWTYVCKEDFDKYSPEVIKRYSSGPLWNGDSYTIELYQMINSTWEEVEKKMRLYSCWPDR